MNEEKNLRLQIKSRTGKFNLLSDEESISCNISVFDGNERIMGTNITLDYEENPTIPYVDDAIYLLEQCFKKMFIDTSRKDKEELLSFLKAHKKEIDAGSVFYRQCELIKKIESLSSELEKLSTPPTEEE